MTRRRETGPSAAELIVVRVRALLLRRLAWLKACDEADTPEDEAAWQEGQPAGEEAASAKALKGRDGLTWTRLVALFDLSDAEQDLLQIALAVAIEPALGPLLAAAQGTEGPPLPTEALARRLGGWPALPIWRPSGALGMWSLVRPIEPGPGEALRFEADPRIVDWMFGVFSPDRELALALRAIEPGPVPGEWPVEATVTRIRRALDAGGQVRLVVEARPGSGRPRFGAEVARRLERQPLLADPAPLAPDNWAENFMRLQRFASYARAALVWRRGAPAWPDKIALAPVQVICVDEGEAPPARDGASDLVVRLPEPARATKVAAWRELAPQLPEADDKIATIPGLSLADLEHVARTAPATVDEATSQFRALARSRLTGVGRAIDPQFGWDDLVVADDTEARLRRVAFEARARASLFDTGDSARVFSGSAGLSALFSGPPGVGKSTAAQVIARDLGVNLLVVDLAVVTSKYIGETAKNLTLAFEQARAAGAVLLFDEADALFARRTEIKDSNDRHANADTGHLLQLLDAHDGVAILATNRRSLIDPAFVRRLRHAIDFPRPSADKRAQIWTLALDALSIRLAKRKETIAQLAARHDLSPAQIKGAVLSARYTALQGERKVTAADLEAGAAAELIKEGRSASSVAVAPIRPGRMAIRG
jgi:hypothetical protein